MLAARRSISTTRSYSGPGSQDIPACYRTNILCIADTCSIYLSVVQPQNTSCTPLHRDFHIIPPPSSDHTTTTFISRTRHIMAPSLHTPLLTFITLVSTTLLAISIATLGLTAHYTHGIGSAGGSYIWYGAVDSPERAQYWKEFDAGNVTQERFHFAYDGENERWISASAALGLLAGLAGLVMCGWSWWNKKQVCAVCLTILDVSSC
jgi:hypothetical protein